MIYYAATFVAPPPLVEHYRQAASATAASVSRALRATLLQYRWTSLEQMAVELWNILRQQDAEMRPVDRETAQAALAFAEILPRSLPVPEIAADPDGEVSFDWLGPAGRMFSVSVSKDGRIAYAGRFGENSKIHGI